MANATLTRFINSQVWGDADAKLIWKMMTDTQYSVDPALDASQIYEQVMECDKEVRIVAQKTARAEYQQWVREITDEDAYIHECDVRDLCIVRYWNRVAELCGL